MKHKVKKALQRAGVRYLVIGGTVYLFELLVIIIAQYFGASAIVAVGLSFWLGFLISFALQKLVTFKDKRMRHHILIPQLLATCALVLFNFGFTLMVTRLLAHAFPATITRTLALAITTIWNFYLYKTRIFKAPDDLNEPVY